MRLLTRNSLYKNSGVGVVATQPFKAGEFLLEYVGERISKTEGEEREKRLKLRFYLFYFRHGEKSLW
jgi:SET domain-containing protein